MKAISLWQPWASLIAVGAKKYETRSWATNYRGPLLICAAKGGLCTGAILELIENNPAFQKALEPMLPPDRDDPIPYDYLWGMNFGAAVAVADLTECISTIALGRLMDQGRLPYFNQSDELHFGNYEAGRYAWKFENVRRITPFRVKGRQGIFEVAIPEGLI